MKIFIQIFIVASGLFLIGCGGGGNSSSSESSSLSYNGKTTAAKLDKNNVSSFLEFVTDSSGSSELKLDDSSATKALTSFERQSKIINGATGTLDTTRTTIDNVTTQIVTIFKNYTPGYENSEEANFSESTLTGTITYLVTVDRPSSDVIKNIKTIFSLLQLKSIESDVTIDGVKNTLNDYITQQSTSTENLIIQNNKSSESIKFENFVTVWDKDDRALSYTGKVYISSEGYVVFSTPVQLAYTEESDTPNIGGEILWEGNDTSVKERFAYDGSVRLEIDNGKDGTVDEVEVYNIETLQVVANRPPVVKITFPQEIFTNTDLSAVNVNSYDPDLDEVSITSEWKINNTVKSSNLTLDNGLFKKHDILKLTVVAKDNRGSTKVRESKEDKVLNSRPVITSSFSKLTLTLGETKTLDYTIFDADNDTIEIKWEHAHGFDDTTIEEYLAYSNSDCTHGIQEYDIQYDIPYDNLTLRGQEDIRNAICSVVFYTKLSHDFINDTIFSAIAIGYFKHKMIVSDGDYNRTRRWASHISQMDLIESQESNHENYTYNDVHSVYMKDMNNDGNKDLIHITGLDVFSDEEPVFVIEYRDGKTLLEKVEHNISNLTRFDLDDYYIKDLNGDGKLDVLFVYGNVNDTSDHTSYGKMLQKEDGSFSLVEKFTLDNRQSLFVDNILGDKAEEIIILNAENFISTNEVKIYSKEENKTIITTLPRSMGSSILDTQILSYDLDENSKKDIIVINKNSWDEGKLNFVCSVLSQEVNGSFTEKVYSTTLQDNLSVMEYESIQNVKIVDIDDKKAIWIVQSSERIYFLQLESNKLVILNSIKYESTSRDYEINIFNPVDINGDGKDDIVIALEESYPFVHIFIQKDDLEFLTLQHYTFRNADNGNTFEGTSSSVLGDIDNDGKQELFVTTGEEELSVLYFK